MKDSVFKTSFTFETALDHLQTEVAELGMEIGKGSMYGMEFKRDGQHTAIERIRERICATLACLEILKEGGCNLTKIEEDKFNRKMSIINMEILMKDKNMFPIPPDRFTICINLYCKLEEFIKYFPLSVDNFTLGYHSSDTYNLLRCVNWKDRNSFSRVTYTDYENIIFDYWCEKLYNRRKESKSSLLMDYLSEGGSKRRERRITDIVVCTDWLVYCENFRKDSNDEIDFMLFLIRTLIKDTILINYKNKDIEFYDDFNNEMKRYINKTNETNKKFSTNELLKDVELIVSKVGNNIRYTLKINSTTEISERFNC